MCLFGSIAYVHIYIFVTRNGMKVSRRSVEEVLSTIIQVIYASHKIRTYFKNLGLIVVRA